MARKKKLKRRKKEKVNANSAAMHRRPFKPIPCEPTKALPGTKEKMDVLRSRMESGQELWNQDDATQK